MRKIHGKGMEAGPQIGWMGAGNLGMHEDGRKGVSGDRKKEKTIEGRKKGRERGDRKENK